MYFVKLVNVSSGITHLFEDICFSSEKALINGLPLHEDGYDAIFDLVPDDYSPHNWIVRFNKVITTSYGVTTQEIEDFRPLAQDR